MTLAALVATAVAAVAPTPEAPVVVDGKPISRGHLRHWAEIATKVSGAPQPQPVGKTERWQAAGLLISRRWVQGEMDERGLPAVTHAEVTTSFREQRRAAFPRRAGFRAFLRESGQTRRDIRTRVRLDLQATRLRADVVAGIADPEAQQAAMDAYVAEYRRRWLARTVCLAPWIDESSCGRIIRRD